MRSYESNVKVSEDALAKNTSDWVETIQWDDNKNCLVLITQCKACGVDKVYADIMFHGEEIIGTTLDKGITIPDFFKRLEWMREAARLAMSRAVERELKELEESYE